VAAGTGFCSWCPGKHGIPTDEMEIAEDLYEGLQGFFRKRPELRRRPLFITGESYAGKYVPSIGRLRILLLEHCPAMPADGGTVTAIASLAGGDCLGCRPALWHGAAAWFNHMSCSISGG